MLQTDPAKRPTTVEISNHPWLTKELEQMYFANLSVEDENTQRVTFRVDDNQQLPKKIYKSGSKYRAKSFNKFQNLVHKAAFKEMPIFKNTLRSTQNIEEKKLKMT